MDLGRNAGARLACLPLKAGATGGGRVFLHAVNGVVAT